ncbi:MAG: hypothetical protein E7812_17650 [Phenylobacterium sp.]|nr:MAG: hypothetical protein E7812_17650 [Phenylobacterium sp.]
MSRQGSKRQRGLQQRPKTPPNPSRDASSSSSAEQEKPSRWRDSIAFWCGVIVAIATVITLAITALGSGHSPSTAAAKEGHLQLTDAYIKDGPEEDFSNSTGPQRQTGSSTPTIELLLLNSTTARQLITAVLITVEGYARLETCFSQGGGPIPEPYPYIIGLPAQPLPSERVLEAHLHDQIGPDEPDRLALRFATSGAGGLSSSIYKLHIALRATGATNPFDAGRFIVTTPGAILGIGSIIPVENTFLEQFVTGTFKSESSRLHVTWCMKRNLAALEAVLGGHGKRTPELALLDHSTLASRWAQLQDHTPARLAATRLLKMADPLNAAYAADQTADPAFQAQVKTLAAKELLARAGRELTGGGTPSVYGEGLVRSAIELEPSAGARAMLAEFQRRLVGQEPADLAMAPEGASG